MTKAMSAYSKKAAKSGNRTISKLRRWSILEKRIPAVEKIKQIHVYDFDNTLFRTPLPNARVWNGATLGMLMSQDTLINGGWWHDSRILAATGEGIEVEEPRGWAGWWNEVVVELVQLSMKQKDALCVLLTGRGQSRFSGLMQKIAASRSLDFDLITLKPTAGPDGQAITSTIHFKQMFLEDLMDTYKLAEEIRIYEDRSKHVKDFRDFLQGYAQRVAKGLTARGVPGKGSGAPIRGEVVAVNDISTTLDPVVEVTEVQKMINDHNAALLKQRPNMDPGDRLIIKKSVFYTGYLIDQATSQALIALGDVPQAANDNDIKLYGNNIMICPRPCPPHILEKAGGIGSKLTWQVTGIARHDNSMWALRVTPVCPSASYHTDYNPPVVVLALRKGTRFMDVAKIEQWDPPPAQVMFETTVGEKMLLRVETQDGDEPGQENSHAGRHGHHGNKRKHPGDEDVRPIRNGGQKGFQQGQHGGRNGRNHGRVRGGGGHGRERFRDQRGGRGGNRGGNFHYKSLDDVGTRDMPQVSYDDTYPALPSQARQHIPQQSGQGQYSFNDQSQSGQKGRGWSQQQQSGSINAAQHDLSSYY